MKLEELKIIKLTCLLVFGRGLEFLLLRETMSNTGVSDNVILNRKIATDYWEKIYAILDLKLPSSSLHRIFNERSAAALSQKLAQSNGLASLVAHFIRKETGLHIAIAKPLAEDGNILFSLGTVHGHRFFRLVRFFNAYWGTEDHEPAIRVIAQKLWFFYLVAWGRISVSEQAFSVQRCNHELGIFTFLMDDYRTFTGTYRQPNPPLSPQCSADVEELLNVRGVPILY